MPPIIQSLQWRYATKVFNPEKKLTSEQWETLKQALILSPSSYGLQPYKFLSIENADLRKKLRAASWGQSQVEDASHFVVILGLKDLSPQYVDEFIQITSDARNVPADSPSLQNYKKVIVGDLVEGPRHEWVADWAARQAYIALGNVLTVAADLKVDACPMEGLDPAQYDEILDLKDSPYRTLAALALGFRSDKDKYSALPKVRFSEEKLIEVR